jgi:hypothetical protein
MSQDEFVQGTAPESAAQESDPIQGQPVAPDTTETVAETDEQKNQRELAERQKRSERATRGIQKRFDELTAARHSAEREKEQLLGLVQSLVGRGQQPAQQPDANQAPQRGTDEAYEDWVARKAEWHAERKAETLVRQQFEAVQRQSGQAAMQQAAVQVRTQFEGRMAEFAKATPDWDAVVAKNEDIEIPDESVGLIHMRPDGAQILYAIGKNPALAAQLQGKSALEQAMVIGQISAQLKAPQQVSKAAPPGSPVGTRSGAQTKDVKSMSIDEYYASITTRKGKK